VAEPKIVPVRTVVSPEDRKRRLSRVYTILLDLAAQQEAGEPSHAMVGLPATGSTERPSRICPIPTPPLASGAQAIGGGLAHHD